MSCIINRDTIDQDQILPWFSSSDVHSFNPIRTRLHSRQQVGCTNQIGFSTQSGHLVDICDVDVFFTYPGLWAIAQRIICYHNNLGDHIDRLLETELKLLIRF